MGIESSPRFHIVGAGLRKRGDSASACRQTVMWSVVVAHGIVGGVAQEAGLEGLGLRESELDRDWTPSSRPQPQLSRCHRSDGESIAAGGARSPRRRDRSLLCRLLDGGVNVEGPSKPDDAQTGA